MAPEFQSSFIPKGAATQEVFKKKKTGLAGFLAMMLFIASILGSGGVYLYKRMLNSDITNLQSQLAQVESSLDTKSIAEMSQFQSKLRLVKGMVDKHEVISNFMDELASSTVSTLQWTEFAYGSLQANELKVAMSGQAADYASIALQEDVLRKSPSLKSIEFSDLGLSEGGKVSFKVSLSLNPQILIYAP